MSSPGNPAPTRAKDHPASDDAAPARTRRWPRPPNGGILTGMFRGLFSSARARGKTFATPPSTRIYAIGDIHGRADLLRRLRALIVADADASTADRNVVVYLGDYVDRGEASREVIDIIIGEPLGGLESVYLMGNHEDIMLMFLNDPSAGNNWYLNGGDATFYSYGVGRPQGAEPEERWELMREELKANLPEAHHRFLLSLKLTHEEGDYLFVHAGIRPGRRIDQQERADLLWIREEFLESKSDHGKCVVHGHTIGAEVDVRANRIGIDTGAYYSGKLTCLVLEGTDRRLIQT